jgi:hypothetical protein
MAQTTRQPAIRTVSMTMGRSMFGNKVIVDLALLFAFGGAAVGSITLWKITTQSESFLRTNSPKGTYTVWLTGRKDWFDPSFDGLYPDHAWESDNILHFYKKEFFSDGQPDKIVVLNKT